jgi:hypothetical protein
MGTSVLLPPSLNFRLNGLSDRVGVSTIEKFDPENIGVAVGILFLSALELEIHLGGSLPPLDNQRKYFILDIRRVKLKLNPSNPTYDCVLNLIL